MPARPLFMARVIIMVGKRCGDDGYETLRPVSVCMCVCVARWFLCCERGAVGSLSC